MNTKKYRWLLYTITLTIVATIAVQVYWNYKNYQQNKQRVINEIQLSLDNALEEYFADIVKADFLTINGKKIDSIYSNLAIPKNGFIKRKFFGNPSNEKQKNDTSFNKFSIEINATSHKLNDSIIKHARIIDGRKKTNNKELFSDIELFGKNRKSDSINLFNNLRTIYISVSNDSTNYQKLDSLLKKQLKNKKLKIDYSLNHIKGDSIFFNSKGNNVIFKSNNNFNWRNISSKSTYLKNNEQFKVLYKDSSFEALKRSSTGILLSFLLSIAIISCLFYLLKIINKQKELAEIKNDLISNITHEFKTPITTVSAALEAIGTFNAIDDKEKTKKYVAISNLQLKKLHQMVEKLLETATLDSEKLLLQKEAIDVVLLVKNASLKDEFLSTEKSIEFNSFKDELFLDIDPFHFENAISNLIDNAIKYGGNKIEVHMNIVLNNLEITIADNGNDIEKNQRDKIFDKFYRIPKGNTHNVKGFGIGLYYTKKIIEKHQGEICLIPNSTNTIFKITLPI
jgi:two-component system phosphate regulon sensor histidine kinase PhoR